MPCFSLRRVTKYRSQPGPDGKPRPVAVLKEITAEIPRGEMFVVMGASGSGKSTLLRLLNRLEEPDAGEVLLEERPVSALPVIELRRRVVLVGQQPAPFAGTVADNLAYALKLEGLARAEIAARAEEALGHVGLPAELLNRPADQLSVGQQQRVCLARALALRPQALLLDEPTAPLDPRSADLVLEQITGLRRRLGLTVVYVTHRLADARALGGTALILAEGRAAELGETGAVLDAPRSAAARSFLQAESTEEGTG